MHLTIQILLLFLFISFFAIFDKGEAYKSKLLMFIFSVLVILLIIITGFRDGNIVTDYSSYKIMYDNDIINVEPSFILIKYIFKTLLKAKIEWFMLFYAILAMSIKVVALKELTNYLFLSLMVFVGDLYLQQDFTQIRGAVAISLMLLSFKYIYSREKNKFAWCCIFAVFFHFSAIIMVPLWFFDAKKINIKLCFSLIIICYILAIVKFNPMQIFNYVPIPYIQKKVFKYITQNQGLNYSANIFGFYSIIKLILLCLLLIKHKILIQYNKYSYIFLKTQLLSSLSLLIFSQNIAIALRISEFFSSAEILLFPLFPVIFKNKIIARIILFLICLFLIFLRIFRHKLIII